MTAPSIPRTVLCGLAYILAVLASDSLSSIGLYRSVGVSPWSPSTGLTLALAYLIGPRFWPYVLLAQTLSSFLINPVELPVSLRMLSIAASAAAWTSAGVLLKRLSDFDPMLRTLRAVLIFFGVAGVGAVIDAAFYVGPLWLSGVVTEDRLFAVGWRYFVGDVVGALVIGPLLLRLSGGLAWPAPTKIHAIQAILLLVALWIIFGYRDATTYQLFYLLFIPVLWVALREGTLGAVLVINATQIGLLVGAHLRFGLSPGIGALQILMIVMATTALLVGVVVTERRATSQRLRDQQTAINRALRLRSAGETAAAIAHQINQPLTAISTYASIAGEALHAGNTDLAGATLTKLSAECDRAAAVLRSVRDLVKQGSLSREPVKLMGLVSDLAALHRSDLDVSRVALKIDFSERLPILMLDKVQLEQALDNLVNNSLEAIRESGRPGTITISARLEGSDALIDVEDDGPGFAPGLEAIATTPFMTTKIDGSGLGLAIARSVAETHGGSLSITPRSPGARVRLRLPIVKRD